MDILVSILILVTLIAGFCFGCFIGNKILLAWLIENGWAEYYLDENHERQWRMTGQPLNKKENNDHP